MKKITIGRITDRELYNITLNQKSSPEAKKHAWNQLLARKRPDGSMKDGETISIPKNQTSII